MKKIKNYINGNIITTSNDFLPIFDPSKGEKIGEVVNSNSHDFDDVIKSSEKCF